MPHSRNDADDVLCDIVQNGDLKLFAQPIVPLQQPSGRLEFEILTEMRHPGQPFVPMETLVQFAERNDLAIKLDMAILGLIFRDHGERLRARPEIDLSINLSSVTVGTGPIDDILALIHESGIAPTRLQFELTESAALAERDAARIALERLRALGCRIALDDFGTGRSNFWRARHLPVDCLKLDGAFLQDYLDRDSLDALIVTQIRDFATRAGMMLVAEKVDRPALVTALTQAGIDKAQGFCLGHRMPLDQVLA